jgi:diadenosine tetraphosphatase ApaH/serine/threonine PP2A family protein phosphatase
VQCVSGEYGRRVALFGGCYSNWVATSAVIEDATKRGAEAVWFLGDAGGFGPCPDRTLDTLRATGVRAVQGNYDASVGDALDDCGCGYTDPADNAYAQISYDYTLANTSREHRRWLAALPAEARIRLGGKELLLCHGSPRRVNEFLWASTTPAGFIDHMCASQGVHMVACTHTGLHWERRLAGGRGLVNVGAVGRPANDGRVCAWYTMLSSSEGHIETDFIPVDYDPGEVMRTMRCEGLPEAFIETLATGWWTTCLEIMPRKERFQGRH